MAKKPAIKSKKQTAKALTKNKTASTRAQAKSAKPVDLVAGLFVIADNGSGVMNQQLVFDLPSDSNETETFAFYPSVDDAVVRLSEIRQEMADDTEALHHKASVAKASKYFGTSWGFVYGGIKPFITGKEWCVSRAKVIAEQRKDINAALKERQADLRGLKVAHAAATKATSKDILASERALLDFDKKYGKKK